MALTWIWVGFTLISTVFALYYRQGAAVSAAALEGAQSGIQLSISLCGSICLWSGVGQLMERLGLTQMLAKLLSPVLFRLFPEAKKDPALAGSLSANVCANLLGLGNAATPMGTAAVKRLQDPLRPERATDPMCRLVVMNTASIQLLPTTVAAIRSSAGAAAPFDLLPCVWVSSILSLSAGLIGAWLLGRWRSDG